MSLGTAEECLCIQTPCGRSGYQKPVWAECRRLVHMTVGVTGSCWAPRHSELWTRRRNDRKCRNTATCREKILSTSDVSQFSDSKIRMKSALGTWQMTEGGSREGKTLSRHVVSDLIQEVTGASLRSQRAPLFTFRCIFAHSHSPVDSVSFT